MEKKLIVNQDKKEIVSNKNGEYYCYAIRSKVVERDDKLMEVVDEYAAPLVEAEDILFISEKIVAITQNRAIPIKDIKPSKLATFLSKYVTKTKHGIGLGMPETMQCALDECGTPRILFASAVGAVGKVLGKKGWFYHIAGEQAASIDGPCDYTLPPYNEYVVLGPRNPDTIAKEIQKHLNNQLVLIVDLNDLGGKILGSSSSIDHDAYLELFKQNPLGQSSEQTPFGILRKKAN